MAQDNAPNKPVHLVYLCGGLLLFYLLKWTTDWVWGYFTLAPNQFYVTAFAALAAIIAGTWFYKNERSYGLVNEVTAELKKVTWPTAKEVQGATIVVVVMTILSATILALFDVAWSNLTELIYG